MWYDLGMSESITHPKPTKKRSSVRHTRAIQRDRTKRPASAPPDEQVRTWLTEIVHPATFNQVRHFHDLGLRQRVLNLPVMMAFVALLRQVGLLRDQPDRPLAGRIAALLDLVSRLPLHIWYEPDAHAHDQRFWPTILAVLKAGSLLIFDLGYTNFACFAQLTASQVTWLTRARRNLKYQTERWLVRTARVHDQVVWIGSGAERQQVRLVEVLYAGKWYRYLTSELDFERLPTAYVVALYWQRWRIEDAFNSVKRLLGLAYFWSGAQNAVELQVWATRLLYAALVDLTDAVAEALGQPFAAVSLEMVYRSLYFFTQAYHRGEATHPATYLAANARLFGIVKRKRKSDKPSPLTFLPLTLSSDP